jgi:hypothetical protein
MLVSGLLTLTLGLAIVLTVLVVSDLQTVQADVPTQPVVTNVGNTVQYARLTDAPPHRDITTQRFAPLEAAR